MYAKGPSLLIGQFQWLDHVYQCLHVCLALTLTGWRVESNKLGRELFARYSVSLGMKYLPRLQLKQIITLLYISRQGEEVCPVG